MVFKGGKIWQPMSFALFPKYKSFIENLLCTHVH